MGRLNVFVALEKAEKTCLVIVERNMVLIDDRSDPADNFSVFSGQEEFDVRMSEERIFLTIEKALLFRDERGNPKGIMTIYFPRKGNKLPKPLFISDRFDCEVVHRHGLMWVL